MGWGSALPFFFYASPAPLACRGGRFVHPVSGCSRYDDVSLVWGEVTLLPFPYLRVGVLLACGFSGIRGSSRLWVRGRIIFPQAAAVGFGLCGSTQLSSLLMGRC